jgi:NADPH:quinone reductase-like Zn-dependent oxidoreductase
MEEIGANIPAIKIYPDKFEDQVVVVTGAAQGIGEVTAKLFAAQGARVVLVDLNKEKLEEVSSKLSQRRWIHLSRALYRIRHLAKSMFSSTWLESTLFFGSSTIQLQSIAE